MFYQIFKALDRLFDFQVAKAHCDVPCGIYDPGPAQIDALTVVRMMDLMADLDKAEDVPKKTYHNSMNRYIAVKETHAEKAKHEVRIIWGDFLKKPQFEKHPEFPDLVHRIMLLGSKCRQTADREVGVEFVRAINRFAELFWDTKSVSTRWAKAPYAPALDMVYPNL